MESWFRKIQVHSLVTSPSFFSTLHPMSFQTRRIRADRKSSLSLQKTALFLVALARPIVGLYRKIEQRKKKKREHEKEEKRERRSVMSVISIGLALCLVIFIMMGSIKLLAFVGTLMPLRAPGAAAAELKKDSDGFTNILLLGVGDDGHDGIDLTDTIMVASIDPTKTHSIVMLSIPRDLHLTDTKKMGVGRINELYRNFKIELIRQGYTKEEASKEAMRQLADELGTRLHMQIHDVLKINFSGFEQAIDAIGGIDVTVAKDIIDTEYPGPNYTYETFSISAGDQHLDGATALKYARSRHSSSDFSRSGRQQQIITAAIAKMKASGFIGNIGNISRLYNVLSKNVESTMSLKEMITLASAERNMDTSRIISQQLSDQNGLYGGLAEAGGFLYTPPRSEWGGASILLPVSAAGTPLGNWDRISLFTDFLLHHRDWYLAKPRIAVLNAGSKPGSAGLLATELIRFGFNVVSVKNFEDKKDATLVQFTPPLTLSSSDASASDIDAKQATERQKIAQAQATFFAATLGAAPAIAAQTLDREDAPEILIITGKDFAYTSLPSLLAASGSTAIAQ